MATLVQYLKILRDTTHDVAMRFGVDLAYEDKALRAATMGVLATQAILIKRLVDNGVITDAELLAAVNAVRNSDWTPDKLRIRPEPWETAPVTGVGAVTPPVTGV